MMFVSENNWPWIMLDFSTKRALRDSFHPYVCLVSLLDIPSASLCLSNAYGIASLPDPSATLYGPALHFCYLKAPSRSQGFNFYSHVIYL